MPERLTLSDLSLMPPEVYPGLSDEEKIRRLMAGRQLLPVEYAPGPESPRRDMRPSEVDALMAQGQQGLQPEYPTSLMDLVMQPVMSFLDEADLSKYLLPMTLLGMVRYKRPGVSAAAREAAEAYHAAPRMDPIGEKATVFHATDPGYVESILKAGEIVPDPRHLESMGLKDWESLKNLKVLDPMKDAPPEVLERIVQEGLSKWPKELKTAVADYYGLSPDDPGIWKAVENFRNPPPGMGRSGHEVNRMVSYIAGPDNAPSILASVGYRMPQAGKEDAIRGVSVSRVPRVASKDTKAVSFVVPQEKMPPVRPFTEKDYMKTQPGGWYPGDVPELAALEEQITRAKSWDEKYSLRQKYKDLYDREALQRRVPNYRFEFEDRTFDKSIPTKSIREMWVDKSALPGYIRPDADPSLEWWPGQDAAIRQTHDSALQTLRDLAMQYGLPMREFESGREMHAGRAKKK